MAAADITAVLILGVAAMSVSSVHLVVADSGNPISFPGGVCLYCPVNTTYTSRVLTLKLDFAAGMGLKHNLTYDVDGAYKGTIPLELQKPDELHVVNPTTGTVRLPALSGGSHCLTIHVVCGLYGYLGANPPGAPFKQTAPGSIDWEATWTHTVFFSIDSKERYQPQFSPSPTPTPSATVSPFPNETWSNPTLIITIKDDGSVEGTNQMQRNGNVYTFMSNISGTIQVKKSNIVIDGAGFTREGNGSTGIAIPNEAVEHPSEREIWNVTVKNLRITNCKWGIHCVFGGNHTFYGNYISNDFVTQNATGGFSWENLGIMFWGSSGNNITRCTIGGSPAIYMHFAVSNNFVTENNIVFGADIRISGTETFDGNFWSDYPLKYPNATEVDSSGVWNTPYFFADSSNFENREFQDNHPSVNPITIPKYSTTLPTVQSIQETMDTQAMLIAVSTVAAVIAIIGLSVYFKKLHKPKKPS